MNGQRGPQRVRQRHIEWLAERLTPRDWLILSSVDRVRLLTGSQLERLAFSDLTGRSQSVVRWRVLKRLVDWRVLLPLPRRIGGITRGSGAIPYALDSAGISLVASALTARNTASMRRFSVPGERFIRHVLGVSELYVQLVESTRVDALQLEEFRAEPLAWVPDGLGNLLKPDAFCSVSCGEVIDDWFIELDLATEHIPTLRRKLDAYLSYRERGQTGPNGVMPRVLFMVPDEHRKEVIRRLIEQLPEPGPMLAHVTTQQEFIGYIVRVLLE